MRNPRRNKLDVRTDYEYIDTGTSRAKFINYNGWDNLHRYIMHEDYLYERRLLASSIGKNWDEVYSKWCERYDARTYIGYWMRRSILNQVVHGYPNHRWGHHYFVDDNGNLQEYVPELYVRTVKPLDKIHWYGDVWFERVPCANLAKCGCLHFRRPQCLHTYDTYCSCYAAVEVCMHGNLPLKRYRWEIVTYAYHALDEVYSAYQMNAEGKTVSPGEEVASVYKVYYKDKPEHIKYTKSRKTPNKKELQIIKVKGGVV